VDLLQKRFVSSDCATPRTSLSFQKKLQNAVLWACNSSPRAWCYLSALLYCLSGWHASLLLLLSIRIWGLLKLHWRYSRNGIGSENELKKSPNATSLDPHELLNTSFCNSNPSIEQLVRPGKLADFDKKPIGSICYIMSNASKTSHVPTVSKTFGA
jgi:hypothetical protein